MPITQRISSEPAQIRQAEAGLLDSVAKWFYEAAQDYGTVRERSVFGIPASFLPFAAIRAAHPYGVWQLQEPLGSSIGCPVLIPV